MATCGSCHKEIRICDNCGGLICEEGCIDRAEDGCTCEEEETAQEEAASE